jgi:hypothetical protein
MKGTAISVLIMGETPNNRKASILHSIKLDREIIAIFTKHNSEGVYSESITILRSEIKDSMAELIKLERWRRQEGIDKDEAFKPRSLREKLANMTEEERYQYAERKAELQVQINELEEEYKWQKMFKEGEQKNDTEG